MPAKTVVYLSGPMSGLPDFNFPAFDAAAADLRSLGYRVINPADIGVKPHYEWVDYITRDLMVIGYADVVAKLPGWESSKGATLECDVAVKLGKHVVTLAELAEIAGLAGNGG